LGLLAGVPLSLAAERLIHDLLFEVTIGDPPMVMASAIVLFASAAAAGCIPAVRASRVDPVVALRYEYPRPRGLTGYLVDASLANVSLVFTK
jgi:ABC-type lipoprotein release transport system permease subunit